MIELNFKEIDNSENENSEPDYFKFAHEASLIVLELLKRGKKMGIDHKIEKIEQELVCIEESLTKSLTTDGESKEWDRGYIAGLDYCLSILKGI